MTHDDATPSADASASRLPITARAVLPGARSTSSVHPRPSRVAGAAGAASCAPTTARASSSTPGVASGRAAGRSCAPPSPKGRPT